MFVFTIKLDHFLANGTRQEWSSKFDSSTSMLCAWTVQDGSHCETGNSYASMFWTVQAQPKKLTIDSDIRLHQLKAHMPEPEVSTTVAPGTPSSPGLSTPVKHVSKLPDTPLKPAHFPTMEPSCETPTHTPARQSGRQLTYTEPHTPDPRPTDLPLGPPLVETTHLQTPSAEIAPTPPRRSSRVKNAPAWQKDFVM
jgi:hypothetical protein